MATITTTQMDIITTIKGYQTMTVEIMIIKHIV